MGNGALLFLGDPEVSGFVRFWFIFYLNGTNGVLRGFQSGRPHPGSVWDARKVVA